ncbi:MAG TPA: glycosyltransferase, partial [Rhodothermales bacterium]|nr:glycosyltransferase [Rhodothermales bacterium]
PRAAPPPADGHLPAVAVLVAARDEAHGIGRCLDALLAQDYPADRLTILVADDHSTDRTAEIVRRYEAQTRRLALAGAVDEPEPMPETPEVRYVRVPDPTSPLRGKALAIHTAAEHTDAPLLLITDADCAPAPGWARGLVAGMGDGDGLVGGLTLMQTETTFGEAQSLDWAFLLGVASALTESGFPATAMGNNLAIRREAYEAVGGYPGVGFSVTEDHALFSAIATRTPWRLRFPLRPETLVWTLPARSLGHAYRQRRRWARGGLNAGPVLWAAYVLAHLAHLIPLLALAVAPLAGLGALAVKMGADALHLRAVLRRGGGGRLSARAFLLFEAWLFAYMSTLPLALLLAPRIRWKGRLH